MNGTLLRRQICQFYRDNLSTLELSGMPVLEHSFIYNDCEVVHGGWGTEIDDEFVIKDGWSTQSGQFIRFNNFGDPIRKGDRTVAALLASIHWDLRHGFNRFFSYVDEVKLEHEIPHKHEGFDVWLENDDEIRAINTDFPEV